MFGRVLCWLTHRRWWGVISERKGYVHAFASFECSRCGLLWKDRVVGLIRCEPFGYRPYESAPSKPPTDWDGVIGFGEMPTTPKPGAV